MEEKNTLEKIRELPLGTRKMIFFGVIILLGIIFVYVWVKVFFQGFEGLQLGEMEKGFRISDLRENIGREIDGIRGIFPDINIPDSSDLKEFSN